MKRREQGRTPSDFLGALGAGAVVIAFCFTLLWHDPLLFWNDDYELSILPVFADVARSWSEGHLPLLSPYSWVCGNLAGEFQYGTFSVFVNAAVVLIWKFPLSFPQQAAALSMAHVFVLAMGGYMLGRGRNFSAPLALMIALVAALNGWIACWGATDWFGALGAFAWFPWAWWGLERALDSARSRWRFLWPAPFVYLLVTGGFPYTVLMLAVLIAWLSLKSLGQTRKLASLWPLLLGVLLGLGLSAPAWLAILDYVQGSAREGGDTASHFQWLLPAAALPGFILPNWTVNWIDFSTRAMPHTATELACGLVPPAAILAGFIAFPRTFVRRSKWELGLLVAVLIISMLPSANVFRWSFRWLPFLHVVLALCAAEAFRVFNSRAEELTAEDPESAEERTKTSASSALSAVFTPGSLAVVLVALAIAASLLFHLLGQYAFPFSWIILGIIGAWALLERSRLRNWTPAIVAVATLLATYLCIPTNCGVPKYNLDQKLTGPAPLDPQRLYLSIYPAPEDFYRVEKRSEPFGTTLRPGSTSMWGGIHLINGYSPIRPSGVAREFAFAIHGEIRPDVGNTLLEQESGPEGILARLGVDGIIVANEIALDPQPETEWELAAVTQEGRVFHRRKPIAIVRSVTDIDSRPNERFASAEISQVVNNRNGFEASVAVPDGAAPALLAVSRPFFGGYRANIGDRFFRVESYRGLMPMIGLPPGTKGRLTIAYRPRWLIWGTAIAAFSCLAMLGSIVAALATSRSRPRSV
ncbi:MAG: hypothetical protein DLM73_03690 [Chthoniobacterales bacterium]|nr:MAG: hypothetical protein DLM73_03690 [Chthoniobacterales bacterium]